MEAEQIIEVVSPDIGLEAVIVIDNSTLGPGVGGTRTYPYASRAAAEADARQLARAMTLKCAIGGLDAGGAKCAVVDHPGLDRSRAFARLGQEVQKLGGRFRTGGDFGTGQADLKAMAAHSSFIHCASGAIGDAVGAGVVACATVAWEFTTGAGVGAGARAVDRPLGGVRVAVQGLGAVGAPVARAFAAAGAMVFCADVDRARAEAVAREVGGEVIPPEAFLTADVDILSPCAIGGLLSAEAAARVRARLICGAANNIFVDQAAAHAFAAKNILVVPDFLSSAGGVIDGIARGVMGVADPRPLVQALGPTTRAVLEECRRSSRIPFEVAEAMALARVAAR